MEWKSRKQIKEKRNWTLEVKLKISLDILDALSTLHKTQWAHEDIKPENIFFTDKNEVKIGDFDIIKKIRISPHLKKSKYEVKCDYISPQLMEFIICRMPWRIDQFKEDVWATGKILFEIFTFKDRTSLLKGCNIDPILLLNEEEKVKNRAKKKMLKCHLQIEAVEIILDMLIFNECNRISMEEAYYRFKNLRRFKNKILINLLASQS